MFKIDIIGGNQIILPNTRPCGIYEKPDAALIFHEKDGKYPEALVAIAPRGCRANASELITYGFGSSETITFSSLNSNNQMLSLQRELVTLNGERIEEQEIKIPRNNSPFKTLGISALLLVTGTSPEDLPGRINELF